jgi:beta-galactosidase
VQIGWLPLKMTGEIWADLILPITANPLAWYKDSKKYYSGTPCVTENQFGKGHVYYLGTSFSPGGIFLLYRHILRNAEVNPQFFGTGIELIDRYTQDGAKVEFILNHNSGSRLIRGKRIPGYSMWINSNTKRAN